MVRIGVAQWCLDRKGPEIMPRAAQLGFKAIHLDFAQPGHEDFLGDKSRGEQFRAAAEQNGVEIGALAIRAVEQIGMLSGSGSEAVGRCRDLIHHGLDTAAKWGVRSIYIPSFFASEVKDENTLDETAAVLHEACEYARPSGITVCTENTLDGDGNKKLAERANHPLCRVLVDTFNPIYFGPHNVQELVKTVRPYMADQIHIKDGRDGKMGNATLGEGDGQFKETAAVLRSAGFGGTVISENHYHDDAERRVAADFAAIHKYLD